MYFVLFNSRRIYLRQSRLQTGKDQFSRKKQPSSPKKSYFAAVLSRRGFNFAIQKLCTLQTPFYAITRDTIERNEIGGGHCRDARIRIWLLHFACDSYTMRSIGSCRLLLPLSDCGTSARLFPPFVLSRREIPTYPHIFIRPYGKI